MSFDLFTGNCFDLLRGFADGAVDAIVTDPPYDSNVHEIMAKGTISHGKRESVPLDFESVDIPRTVELRRLAKRWALFFCSLETFGEYRAQCPDEYVRSCLWIKANASPQLSGDRPGSGAEGIAAFHREKGRRWNGKGISNRFTACTESREVTGHPNGKPLLLCMRLIELFTDPNETVLDPFAGSAAIGIACGLLGRHYVGIEQSPECMDNAGRRARDVFSSRGSWLAKFELYKKKYVGPGTVTNGL